MTESTKELYIEYNDHSFIYFDTESDSCQAAFSEFEQKLKDSGINTDNVLIRPVKLELRLKYDNDALDTMTFEKG